MGARKKPSKRLRPRIGNIAGAVSAFIGIVISGASDEWELPLVIFGGLAAIAFVWGNWPSDDDPAPTMQPAPRQPSTTFDLDNSSVSGRTVISSADNLVRGRNESEYDVKRTEHHPGRE